MAAAPPAHPGAGQPPPALAGAPPQPQPPATAPAAPPPPLLGKRLELTGVFGPTVTATGNYYFRVVGIVKDDDPSQGIRVVVQGERVVFRLDTDPAGDQESNEFGRVVFHADIPQTGYYGTGQVHAEIELVSTGQVIRLQPLRTPAIVPPPPPPPPTATKLVLKTVEGKVDTTDPTTMQYKVMVETVANNGKGVGTTKFGYLYEGDSQEPTTDAKGVSILTLKVKGYGRHLQLLAFLPGLEQTWTLTLDGPTQPAAPQDLYPTEIVLTPDRGTKATDRITYNVLVKVKGRKPGVTHDTAFGPLPLEFTCGTNISDFTVDANGNGYFTVDAMNNGPTSNRVIVYSTDPAISLITYADLDGLPEVPPTPPAPSAVLDSIEITHSESTASGVKHVKALVLAKGKLNNQDVVMGLQEFSWTCDTEAATDKTEANGTKWIEFDLKNPGQHPLTVVCGTKIKTIMVEGPVATASAIERLIMERFAEPLCSRDNRYTLPVFTTVSDTETPESVQVMIDTTEPVTLTDRATGIVLSNRQRTYLGNTPANGLLAILCQVHGPSHCAITISRTDGKGAAAKLQLQFGKG